MIKLCEYIGAIAGIAGTALIAAQLPLLGFYCYLVSNSCLLYVFNRVKLRAALMMQICYFFLTLYGVYSWQSVH